MMPRLYRNRLRGLTLVEILVAVAVSMAFLSGVLMAFMQIIKTSDKSKARLQAVNNARSALELMTIDIKAARISRSALFQVFKGTNNTLAFGNGYDEDRDGRVDEETFDGLDNDNDWNAANDDRHLSVSGNYDRAQFRGLPDLGDGHVDEDTLFSRDSLSFRIFPDPANPQSRDDLVSYEVVDDIAAYGEPNVLVRTITRNVSSGTPVQEASPIAFNILSLDILYWNPNTATPTWTTEWDAAIFLPMSTNIPLPISVYVSVTVNAGTKDIKDYRPGDKTETITLHTLVNIEQVLNDSRWR